MMTYIVLKDLLLLKKKKNMIILYFGIIIMFLLFKILIGDSKADLKSVGAVFSNDFIDILVMGLNYLFYIYFSSEFIIDDYESNISNLFTRIKTKSFCLANILFVVLFVFSCKGCLFLAVKIIFGKNLTTHIFLVNLFKTLNICFLFLISIFTISFRYLLILLFLIISILLSVYTFDLYVLLGFFVLLIGIYIALNKKIFSLYERCEKNEYKN